MQCLYTNTYSYISMFLTFQVLTFMYPVGKFEAIVLVRRVQHWNYSGNRYKVRTIFGDATDFTTRNALGVGQHWAETALTKKLILILLKHNYWNQYHHYRNKLNTVSTEFKNYNLKLRW